MGLPRCLLLIYSYATGVFGSRVIERSTHENVAVRVLCGDTHPDHDTICAFRRDNAGLVADCFGGVLEMAAGCGFLKVGGIAVAIDGTKVLANASKHASVSHGRAGEKMRQMDLEMAELLAKAEAADAVPLEDGLSIPGEIRRRGERKAKLAKARAEMEARAYARAQAEMADYRTKLAAREQVHSGGRKPRGREPVPPREQPGAREQYNFTDPESRIMKMGDGSFGQAHNAQAAVEVDSRLVVGQRVSDAPNDKEQLAPSFGAIEPAAGPVSEVLVDSGFLSETAVATLESAPADSPALGPRVLAAVGRATSCANRPSSPSLAPSKRPWDSGASRCAERTRSPPNGRWCAWPTTSGGSTGSPSPGWPKMPKTEGRPHPESDQGPNIQPSEPPI